MPGNIVGAIIGGKASKKAASTQAKGVERAAELEQETQREALAAIREMFDISREDLAPFREEGLAAFRQLGEMNQPGGYFQQDFEFGMEDFEADPGYQFRLAEGTKAIERGAAARGGLVSGRALKDLQRFGQGLASEEYGRAYGRAAGEFFGNREARFNRLASLAGVGQSTATIGSQLASQAGRDLSGTRSASGARLADLQLQGANTRASGYIGSARAWTGALQNVDQMGVGLLGGFLGRGGA